MFILTLAEAPVKTELSEIVMLQAVDRRGLASIQPVACTRGLMTRCEADAIRGCLSRAATAGAIDITRQVLNAFEAEVRSGLKSLPEILTSLLRSVRTIGSRASVP